MMSLMMDEKKPHVLLQPMRICGTLAQSARLEEEGQEELGSTLWVSRQLMQDLRDHLRARTTMPNGHESNPPPS